MSGPTKAVPAGSPEDLAARIQALRTMTRADLRDRYREVFGEEPRSKHRESLWRQIAWKIQADAEGGLSERARRLTRELARDSDVRVRVPRDAFTTTKPTGEAPACVAVPPGPAVPRAALAEARGSPGPSSRDPRLPVPGTVLSRAYRGGEIRVTVGEDGFEHAGRTYATLSAVAHKATGSRWNGFLFFGLTPRAKRSAKSR